LFFFDWGATPNVGYDIPVAIFGGTGMQPAIDMGCGGLPTL